MEKYRVIKFGGSGLSSASDLQQITRVLKFYQPPVIIVLSAFNGVTDQLEKVLSHSTNIYREGIKLIKHLREMKSNIIDSVFQESKVKNEVKNALENRLEKLDKSLLASQCIGEVPDFLRDDILSYGERLSSLIVSGYLKEQGLKVNELLPEDIPLLTDGVYGNATVDYELCSLSVNDKLEGQSFVIPGFYGVSKKGKKTLLGRGGSDYSAASVAKCVNAASLDVWKDVNGFLSADPRLIDNVRDIKHLSYDEASEIAYFGSEILHPRTVEPLRATKIPVRVYNIRDYNCWPEPQTLINQEKKISAEIIKSISYSDSLALITLSGAGVGIKGGVLAQITRILDQYGINIKSVLTSQIAINLLIDHEVIKKAVELLKDADIKSVENISVSEDISVIAAVGEGLIHFDGLASGIFTAVARKKINVEMICFGASSVAVYFVVKSTNRLETVKALHDYYFSAEKHLTATQKTY